MERMDMLLDYLQLHTLITMVVAVIIFDTFLGVMRSFKEHKTNSSIGIDGMIRKVSILACLVFLVCLDFLLRIDLIGWLPDGILEIFKLVHINKVGISDLFSLLFIVFELLSILKNWSLLGLPMFKSVNDWIEHFLETFTEELPK